MMWLQEWGVVGAADLMMHQASSGVPVVPMQLIAHRLSTQPSLAHLCAAHQAGALPGSSGSELRATGE